MIGDPTELLLFLSKRTTEIQRKFAGGGWAFRQGVTIYINPEARCPLCDEPFPTNRVWIVDEVNHCLPKQFRLRDGSSVDKGTVMYHPHAQDGSGHLCMGSAKTCAQLLFNGISTEYNPQTFLYDMGHMCPHFQLRRCPMCEKKVPTFTLNQGYAGRGLCSAECVRRARIERCYTCFNDRTTSQDYNYPKHGSYCVPCYEKAEEERQRELSQIATTTWIPRRTTTTGTE